MKISAEKSQIFQVIAKKDTWFIKDPAIKIGKVRIPGRVPESAFRYLGAKVWSGGGAHEVDLSHITNIQYKQAIENLI